MIDSFNSKYIKEIENKCNYIKPLLAVRCTAFNQENYIEATLKGFVKQKTNFPFVVIVHDDASSDRTTEIIKEFSKKYPEIILPIFEQENQWSKQNGSVTYIVNKAIEATKAKYLAFCEGDDFWIDQFKLQKQVDFLSLNSEYTLCVSNVNYLYPDGKLEFSPFNTPNSTDLHIKDIILKGGMYISTPSIVTYSNLFLNLPYLNKNFHVGDYPLQIFLAYKGKVRNLKDITSTYRVNSVGSWTSKNTGTDLTYDFITKRINKEMYLLDSMNEITNNKFNNIFRKRKIIYRYESYRFISSKQSLIAFFLSPISIFKKYGFKSICYSFIPHRLKIIFNKYKQLFNFKCNSLNLFL